MEPERGRSRRSGTWPAHLGVTYEGINPEHVLPFIVDGPAWVGSCVNPRLSAPQTGAARPGLP